MSEEHPHRSLTRWSPPRVARLGFLIGQGFNAASVAADPLIASTTSNVHRQARRFGLAFRDAVSPTKLRLTGRAAKRVDDAAARRVLTRAELFRLLIIAASSDDGLIDNILDDGGAA